MVDFGQLASVDVSKHVEKKRTELPVMVLGMVRDCAEISGC